MKLVLSVEALAPSLTGIGRYTWELAQRLPTQHCVQSVLFYRNGKLIDTPDLLVRSEGPPRLPPVATNKRKFKLRQPSWLRDWRNDRVTVSACRGRIFHGPNFFLPACADVGIATVHDLSVFKFPDTHPTSRLQHFEREFAVSMRRATHLITDSEATRREVIEFLGWHSEKITAVPLGVSSQFRPLQPADVQSCMGRYGLVFNRYILCVSTLEPRKNISRLLYAYRLLPSRLQEEYQLVLVGSSGWLSESLHNEVEKMRNAGRLRYLGFSPEADLPSLYAGAALFAYPSTYEGFGLPPIEAMASGTPVLVSNQSCMPEVTKGAALTVDPDDLEAFTQSLEFCLTDQSWRQSARSAGLDVASTYTWERCVDRTIELYGIALRR